MYLSSITETGLRNLGSFLGFVYQPEYFVVMDGYGARVSSSGSYITLLRSHYKPHDSRKCGRQGNRQL